MWIIHNSYFHRLCAALLAAAAYWLGLSGGFYFDDEWNILVNQALRIDSLDWDGLWAATMSGTSGPLGRPVAMLSFALNYTFFGLDPFYFKLVNLTLHILCGWTIYAVCLALCVYFPGVPIQRRKLFAFLVMSLWLLHPLNLTTVLYPVQRMAGLSALFSLLGMLAYLKARQCNKPFGMRAIALYVCCFFIFWPLGLASKENAVLLPGYLFLLELVFLRFQKKGEATLHRPLLISYIGFLVLPVLGVVTYFLFFPDWVVNGYLGRDFTLGERLLTESRILLFYLGQIILPMNSSLGLFHDDIALSTSLMSPWTTLPSVLAVVLGISWALIRMRKFPVLSFGILFFFAAHSLESSVIALELAHEHRNYLAIFPIVMVPAYYLVTSTTISPRIAVGLSVCLIVFSGVTTMARAAMWGSPVLHSVSEAANHPLSPRANYGLGQRYAIYASSLGDSQQKTDALESATAYFMTSADLRSSYTDGLFGLLMMEAIEGFDMAEPAFQELLSRLAGEPFANNNYNYLHSLFDCLERGDCHLAPGKVTSIVSACLENPRFAGQHRVGVLQRYDSYQASQ